MKDWTRFRWSSCLNTRNFLKIFVVIFYYGTSGGAVHWGTEPQDGSSPFRFPEASLEFSIDIIIPSALWPWLDQATNRTEYHEYLLEGKGRCVRMITLRHSCVDCLKIWKPQTPGTLRSWTGIALTCLWSVTQVEFSIPLHYNSIKYGIELLIFN